MTKTQSFIALSLVSLLVVGVSSITLSISPMIWQDEVQIIDQGRVLMPGADQTWGLSWLVQEDRPVQVVSYLGPLVQEIAYTYLGGMQGARLLTLLSAVFAAIMMLGWLSARGFSPWLALFGALLFLLDPMIAQSYRGARVDVLAMGVMFLALWVSWIQSRAYPTNEKLVGWVVVGALVGISGMIWPSAALLLPIFVYEIAAQSNRSGVGFGILLKRISVKMIYVGLAAGVTIVCLVLIAHRQDTLSAVGGLFAFVAENQNNLGSGDQPASSLFSGVMSIIGSFKYSPWILLFGLLLIAYSRRFGLLVSLMIVFALVCITNPYIHRAIYVIPYLMLGVLFGFDYYLQAGIPSRRHFLAKVLFILMLFWSASVTLGARTWAGLEERVVRNPQLVDNFAEELIGEGDYSVYVGPWFLYYAGRQLGWKMHRSFNGIPENLTAKWKDTLLTMDFLIFDGGRVNANLSRVLRANGYEESIANPFDFDYFPGLGLGREEANSGYGGDLRLYKKSQP